MYEFIGAQKRRTAANTIPMKAEATETEDECLDKHCEASLLVSVIVLPFLVTVMDWPLKDEFPVLDIGDASIAEKGKLVKLPQAVPKDSLFGSIQKVRKIVGCTTNKGPHASIGHNGNRHSCCNSIIALSGTCRGNDCDGGRGLAFYGRRAGSKLYRIRASSRDIDCGNDHIIATINRARRRTQAGNDSSGRIGISELGICGRG